MRYGIFNFVNTIANYDSPPPLGKNPQIQPIILFHQIQLCCKCDLEDDHSKNKKENGNKKFRSIIFALKLVLLRHKSVTSSVF